MPPPTHEPRLTKHIEHIIDLITKMDWIVFLNYRTTYGPIQHATVYRNVLTEHTFSGLIFLILLVASDIEAD